jgi:AraC-like DNA-binding protein
MIDYLNTKELLSLLKDFYLLTKIKIVIFDTEYEEIAAYPDSHCSYCKLLRENPSCLEKCLNSNYQSFQHCRKTSEILVYHCHAGLIEATAPLIDNGILVGYIMFGQITDLDTDEELLSLIRRTLSANQISARIPEKDLLDIEKKSKDQILAAAKILEACTFYVLLKNLMTARRQNFVDNLNAYLLSHLDEPLTADQIASDFSISRSKLYSSCEKYLGTGIAQYVKSLRLEKAKELLKSTDLTVSVISEKVGFADYNYFCRVFKQETGLSAKKYRYR